MKRWKRKHRQQNDRFVLAVRRHTRNVCALVVPALLIAACSGGGTEDSVPRRPVQRLEDVTFRAFETNSRAFQIVNRSVERCLAEKGFDWDAGGAAPESDELRAIFGATERRLALATASEEGYGALFGVEDEQVSTPAPGDAPSEIDSMTREQKEALGRALYGDENDEIFVELDNGVTMTFPRGCEGAAWEEAFGEDWPHVKAVMSEVGMLLGELAAMMDVDRRVLDASAKWSTCMTDADYPFETPQEAEKAAFEMFRKPSTVGAAVGEPGEQDGESTTDPSQSTALRPVTQAEIDQAVADATCREESSLYEIRDEVGDELAQDVMADNEHLILRLNEIRDDVDDQLREAE